MSVDELADDIYEFVIESDTESDDDTHMSDEKIFSEYSYSVLAVDIGVINLGISIASLDAEFNLIEIVWVDLINITEFIHKDGPSKEKCKLHHTKTFSDWLNHVFQENDFFEKVDFIVIERQPPMGFVAIEQLIFNRWRHKVVLISPNSMHKYFNIGKFDYDTRKEYTEKIAKSNITDKNLLEKMCCYDRCHDIADSICIMLYWISKKKTEYSDEKRKKLVLERQMNLKLNGKNMSMNEWFECHRYITKF